ncbi:MAG: hypothetical protein E7346_02390 [Clostridiales bacterium]|nr:hypothetical protein [Clostridiales bacterium]MBQ3047183.1 hypothetical protein [Clostridia bacterium]
MEKTLSVGDLVESIAGRDKGRIFLTVSIDNGYALIVDGRKRKVLSPKRKKLKHLKKVLTASEKQLAERIQNGESVGNERVYRAIKAKTEKIQED